MIYSVALKNEEKLEAATEWCKVNLETPPHVNSCWMREWREGNYSNREIIFHFVSEHWAMQFKLMGF